MTAGAERSTVDGVTVLRADAAPGRTTAGLVFRVGRFNETLASSGITHLIEHLTLTGRPESTHRFNAQVGGRFTTFYTDSSDPAEVTAFIADVCQGLTSDRSGFLEHEKRVLRTEAASRGGTGTLGACLNERYGAAGPGLVAYDELGLGRLGWAEVEAWRARWFVTGNAILWVAGEIPAGLGIRLPRGPAPLPAPITPLPLTLPGFQVTGQGGVGVSMTGPRSFEATLALDILQHRLTQVLRHEMGISYAIIGALEPCDAEVTHGWLFADSLPDQNSLAAHTMLATIEDLADRGCRPEEIAEHIHRLRDAHSSPAGPVMRLHTMAENILDGRPAYGPDEAIRVISRISPGTVGNTARAWLSQAIVATPQLVPAVQGRMARLPVWSPGQAVLGHQISGLKPGQALTVGDGGVTFTAGPGQHVTVRYRETAALLRWGGQQIALIGRDGFTLRLDPVEWPNGHGLLASIAASVDPGLIVEMDGPGPVSPVPAAGQPATPAPATAPPRPIAPLAIRLAYTWSVLLWLALGLCALGGLAALDPRDRITWPLGVIAVAGLSWRLGPRIYRLRRPGRPVPRHGWGYRVLRGLLVTWTALCMLTIAPPEVAAGTALTLGGVAALAVQELVSRLRRDSRRPAGQVSGPAA